MQSGDLISRQEVLSNIIEAAETNMASANHYYIEGYQEAYDIIKKAPGAGGDSLQIAGFIKKVGEINRDHGFHDVNKDPVRSIALIISEAVECMNELRDGHGEQEVYYNADGKPEGAPIELADIVIRCMDFAYIYGIDLEKAIVEKVEFNKSRPYLHGKKF